LRSSALDAGWCGFLVLVKGGAYGVPLLGERGRGRFGARLRWGVWSGAVHPSRRRAVRCARPHGPSKVQPVA
jgi:hypothetical protein